LYQLRTKSYWNTFASFEHIVMELVSPSFDPVIEVTHCMQLY
jgi:hypothetical protein